MNTLPLLQAPLNAVLCYVSGDTAYFTTQKLTEQWGDDWNDAPYEHNAGSPYTYSEHDRKQSRPSWQIVTVDFRGDFCTPEQMGGSYSVEQINRGSIAWLTSSLYQDKDYVNIFAGTTLKDFIEMVKKVEGGDVWPEVKVE